MHCFLGMHREVQCINALPAFPLAISTFLLVDTLQEFMGARVMLNFIKLIRITLKTSLFRQTVLRANFIAVTSPSCCLLLFRPVFCCFKASEQVHNKEQFSHVTLSCLSEYHDIFKITSLTVLHGLVDMAVRMQNTIFSWQQNILVSINQQGIVPALENWPVCQYPSLLLV